VVLSVMLTEESVEVLAVGDTVLEDNSVAAIVEYNATILGSRMHCYSLGVRKGEQWIAVNLCNNDQYGLFRRDIFEEIAHTLRFD